MDNTGFIRSVPSFNDDKAVAKYLEKCTALLKDKKANLTITEVQQISHVASKALPIFACGADIEGTKVHALAEQCLSQCLRLLTQRVRKRS
jgi:hypothetical protein